jgi:hypothetical protein
MSKSSVITPLFHIYEVKVKVKQSPYKLVAGPGDAGRLRLLDFETVGR